MNIDIFLIGLATIPFDNLPFAPSAGWATISPIIFFVYCFINLRLLVKVIAKNHFLFLVYFFGAMSFQFMLFMIYGLYFSSFLDGLQTLMLGIAFYFALLIRYEICHADVNSDAEILYKAYLLSFIYGVVWLVLNTASPNIAAVFRTIEKRYYPRLAYTFTEPSFISKHAVGVMLLFSYLVSNTKLAVKFIYLSVAFMSLSILFASSATCAADAAVLLLLMFIRNLMPRSPKTQLITIYTQEHKNTRTHISYKKLAVNILAIFTVIIVFSLSSRLDRVVNKGANSDDSMSIRWFRVNAMLQGFFNSDLATLTGWGMGNIVIPFRSGMNRALSEVSGKPADEIVRLQTDEQMDTMYNFYVKIVAEWGLLIAISIFVYLLLKAKKKKIDIYVVLSIFWLYVQFDSYCFYSIWLLLYLVNYYDPKKHGISYFDILS